jgi:hypothetical protein
VRWLTRYLCALAAALDALLRLAARLGQVFWGDQIRLGIEPCEEQATERLVGAALLVLGMRAGT